MRVIVTGAEGFIGKATVDALRTSGHDVVKFDLTAGLDVRDQGVLMEMAEGCEAMIHLAGILGTHELFFQPKRAIDVNVAGTVSALEVCRERGLRFVGISQPRIWHNPYSTTRAAARDLATGWHIHRGVPVTYVRAFNAHGPHQKLGEPQKILPTFADCAWRDKPLPVWGDGSQLVDLVHVRDLGKILRDALAAPGRNETIDGGTGIGLTVREVAEFVIEAAGSESEIEYLPMRLGEDPGAPVPVATGEGWHHLQGWKPEFSWNDVAETVQWYQPR